MFVPRRLFFIASLATVITSLGVSGCGGGGGDSTQTPTPTPSPTPSPSSTPTPSPSSTPVPTPEPVVGTCFINMTSNAQAMEGIGGSTAWLGALTPTQLNILFGNGTNQLGLSVLRVRIDPEGQSRWADELSNAKGVKNLGGQVIATPWTPPASMKTNNSTVQGELKADQYAAYADYLNTFSAYFYDNGVPLRAISLNNEPDWKPVWESCTWSGEQIHDWVAGQASRLYTPLIVAETIGWDTRYRTSLKSYQGGHNLRKINRIKQSFILAILVESLPSQFFQRTRHLSIQELERSTTQRLEIGTKPLRPFAFFSS
jgi:hypothetical protein